MNVIAQIEQCRETQDNIDSVYDDLCSVITREMNEKIPKTGYSGSAKRLKIKRPYWNDTLTQLWKDMCLKKKNIIRYNGNRNIRADLKREYCNSRDTFNKTLRRSEREY